jgi:hypothetical protein
VGGCCECGDEPLGSGGTELVSWLVGLVMCGRNSKFFFD